MRHTRAPAGASRPSTLRMAMSLRAAITAVFFVDGAPFASWASRIPALADRAHASTGALGLALLAPATGAVLAMPQIGRLLPGVVPTLFRSAAGEPGVPTGPVPAAVSSLGHLGLMVGPPLIGTVAELSSLRAAPGLLVVAVGLMVLLAPASATPARAARRMPRPWPTGAS